MSGYGRSAPVLSQRTREVAKVLWVTLVLNWVIALMKVTFGLATRSMSIVADGAHSFSDGASNIIGLAAVYVSGHPPDHDHPYGHKKYETLASAIIAFLLFAVSFGILREAVLGFIHQRTPEVNALSFLVMVFTLLVNCFVVWYERKKGRLLQSDFLISDSWHTLSDIFITLSVLAALVGIRLNIPYLDSIFAFVIAAVIIVTAIRILKRSSDILVDTAVIEIGRIEKIARSVEGVKDCHEIRTRGRTDDVYVDLHILVDDRMTVLDSHYLTNIIEQKIRKEIPGVQDVVVHIEPVSHEH